MSRPDGATMRQRCRVDERLAEGRHRGARKARLMELAARYGVELPTMASGDLTAILDAEQALVDAGVDPGVAGVPVELAWWSEIDPAGWVTGHGLSRRQALRVLGNGVVPLQAAAAVQHLARAMAP